MAGLVLGPLRQEDRELVRADPADDGAGTGTRSQALGDRDQQLVAGGVAVSIVDVAKLAHVEHDYQRLGPPLARAQGLAQCLREAVAGGQAGEAVLEREAVEFALGELALGDVHVHHDGATRRAFMSVGGQAVDHDPEPALLCRPVAGILQREALALASQHGTQSRGHLARLLGAVTVGGFADLEIALAHSEALAREGVVATEVAPLVVDVNDPPFGVEQGDVGG